METPPNPIYTKEMVDLLMRIKKHLSSQQELAIRLSDPHLFDKLVALHPNDDPLLQGMLQYLMVLAGPEWTQIYNNGGAQSGFRPNNTQDSFGKSLMKKSVSLYRELAAAGHEHQTGQGEHPQADTQSATGASEDKPRKPVRYYRGQPVPED